jgi:sugar-specific transcriptional regulator TrmB
MSEKMYFIQVDGSMHEPEQMQELADTIVRDVDRPVCVVGEEVRPIGKEEFRELLEEFASALDLEVSEK